jgi:hypothetical protein
MKICVSEAPHDATVEPKSDRKTAEKDNEKGGGDRAVDTAKTTKLIEQPSVVTTRRVILVSSDDSGSQDIQYNNYGSGSQYNNFRGSQHIECNNHGSGSQYNNFRGSQHIECSNHGSGSQYNIHGNGKVFHDDFEGQLRVSSTGTIYFS